MKEKSAYHHGDLRASLIEAAFDLLDREGPDQVGIRPVARLAGVAHSAPANHFKNRQALLTSLAVEVFREIAALLATQPPQIHDPVKQAIAHFTNTVLNYGLQHPNRWRLIWRRDCLDISDDGLETAMETVYQHLIQILTHHKTRRPVDVESQAIAIWSMTHGYVSLRLDGILSPGKDDITGQDRQHAIIDVLVDGL